MVAPASNWVWSGPGAPRLMAGEERSSRLGLVLGLVDCAWLEAGGTMVGLELR
jgi:hypothetical protein